MSINKTSVGEEIFADPDFDRKVQYEPGFEPDEDSDEGYECNMRCDTYVVVNYIGERRVCDYCEHDYLIEDLEEMKENFDD
jgi:hypothetical protein